MWGRVRGRRRGEPASWRAGETSGCGRASGAPGGRRRGRSAAEPGVRATGSGGVPARGAALFGPRLAAPARPAGAVACWDGGVLGRRQSASARQARYRGHRRARVADVAGGQFLDLGQAVQQGVPVDGRPPCPSHQQEPALRPGDESLPQHRPVLALAQPGRPVQHRVAPRGDLTGHVQPAAEHLPYRPQHPGRPPAAPPGPPRHRQGGPHADGHGGAFRSGGVESPPVCRRRTGTTGSRSGWARAP